MQGYMRPYTLEVDSSYISNNRAGVDGDAHVSGG